MALANPIVNPIARYYEAQTAATAEVVQAALNGMQRLQQITLQAMRADTGTPAAEQSTRFQRELLQAITEMNQDIVRASYSMMERMRDALGAGVQGAASFGPEFASGAGMMANPMALYDSLARQWMGETPSVAMAVADAVADTERATSPRKATKGSGKTSSRKRKSARKR